VVSKPVEIWPRVVYKVKILSGGSVNALPRELEDAVAPQHLQLLANPGLDVFIPWVNLGEAIPEL